VNSWGGGITLRERGTVIDAWLLSCVRLAVVETRSLKSTRSRRATHRCARDGKVAREGVVNVLTVARCVLSSALRTPHLLGPSLQRRTQNESALINDVHSCVSSQAPKALVNARPP
jgi:hypothetical protein